MSTHKHLATRQEYEIDFVSLSYTRTMDDVVEARDFLDSIGLTATKIFGKLESRQALLNFKGVLNEADGVIISRGNLGLDCLPEKMALIQKNLIQSCNLVGKPCLITRVMDTMAITPRPTRAEATGACGNRPGLVAPAMRGVPSLPLLLQQQNITADHLLNTPPHPASLYNNTNDLQTSLTPCLTASTASCSARRRCAAPSPSRRCRRSCRSASR